MFKLQEHDLMEHNVEMKSITSQISFAKIDKSIFVQNPINKYSIVSLFIVNIMIQI